MDLNKKLVDQLSDLSRNIKSLTSEVKEGKSPISPETGNEDKNIISNQNEKFLKSFEGIFKKGIDGISKESLKSNDVLKDVLKSAKSGVKSPIDLKIPKDFKSILEKIPKFEKGGTMEKGGFAIVGEKGPELLNLNMGDQVISNADLKSKIGIDALTEALENSKESSLKTIDQTLNPLPKKLLESQIEDKNIEILGRDKNDSELEESKEEPKEKIESTIKEQEQKLNKPAVTVENLNNQEDISTKEKKEKKKKSVEELIKNKEEKSKEKDRKKEKLKEAKNILLSKGKDFLSGKNPLGETLKNPSSLLNEGEDLAKKGISTATSLISNKEFRDKNIEKLKKLKSNKEEKKSSLNVESPDLKKPNPEIKKEEKEIIPQENKTIKVESSKSEETKSESPKKESSESPKSEMDKTSKKSSEDQGVSSSDIKDIKSLLSKIANLLQNPLIVENLESPFRPDSRRF